MEIRGENWDGVLSVLRRHLWGRAASSDTEVPIAQLAISKLAAKLEFDGFFRADQMDGLQLSGRAERKDFSWVRQHVNPNE